jgi:glycerol-3-phosphate cytidylyltransferase
MRKSNQVLGFTVGVWDCWHIGHENFLRQAHIHCDYLIVGIMNDYWVQVQKGQDRPQYALPTRMMHLRDSGLADKILILDTLDMSQYLQIADVWIRGQDQRNMKPIDYPNCVWIPRTEGVSTTDILRGMRE